MITIANELVNIANYFDVAGLFKEAASIDVILNSIKHMALGEKEKPRIVTVLYHLTKKKGRKLNLNDVKKIPWLASQYSDEELNKMIDESYARMLQVEEYQEESRNLMSGKYRSWMQ